MDFIIITQKEKSYTVYKHDTESFDQFYDRSWYLASLLPTDDNYAACKIKSLQWQNIQELGYEY